MYGSSYFTSSREPIDAYEKYVFETETLRLKPAALLREPPTLKKGRPQDPEVKSATIRIVI